MKKIMFIFAFFLIFISFASAILTHGDSINIDTSTITYNINGSNINASSFSTACSGSDKVSNVTYSNFTGLFIVVCTTDQTGAGGGLGFVNGSGYLYNDTEVTLFFNTTLANTNLSVNKSNYWDGLNSFNTTQFNEQGGLLHIVDSWLDGIYLKLTSAFGGDVSGTYDNLQLGSDVVGDSELNTTQVTLADFTNDPNFITNATMNKSVSCSDIFGSPDTDFCTDANSGSGGLKADGTYLYNDTTNIYLNTTLTSINLSVNSSNYWDGLNSYNTTHFTEASGGILTIVESFFYNSFYLKTNPFSFVNTTSASNLNYLILSYWANVTDRPTFLSNFTDNVFGNSSLARIGNCPDGQVVMNTTTSGVQCVTPTAVEVDPKWSANLTAHNSTWNSINNATYNEAWLLTTNSTFYKRITNEFSYYNATTFSESDPKAYNGTLAYAINFTNLVNTDCTAGTLVIGIQANGTVLCATDQSSSGLGFVNGTGYLYNDTAVTIFFNSTLAGTNLSVNSSNFWDGLGTINTTTLEEQSGGILGIKFSWLESFIPTIVRAMSDWIDWGDVTNGTLRLTTNHTFNGNTNVTGIFNATYLWGDGSNLTNLPAGTEVDPYWSSNLTIFLNKFNATNFPNYANVYLNTTNQFGYINTTTLTGNETDPDAYNGTLRYANNHTFNGNVNISGNNITNVNFTTFCNGANCWQMYVNASDWFIIEAV